MPRLQRAVMAVGLLAVPCIVGAAMYLSSRSDDAPQASEKQPSEKQPSDVSSWVSPVQKHPVPDELAHLFHADPPPQFTDWNGAVPVDWAEIQAPWDERRLATDTLKRHSITVATSRHTYQVALGGEVDGAICRDPIGSWYWTQSWEPNVAVRMENVGDHDIHNPWLHREGSDYSSLESIVAGLIDDTMSDREKMLTLFWAQKNHGIHATICDPKVKGKASDSTDDNDDPVRFFNIYGYGVCRDVNRSLSALLHEAGLTVRRGHLTHHNVNEVCLEGKWALIDVDYSAYFLAPGSHRLISVLELSRDHSLAYRSRVYGINHDARQHARDPDRPIDGRVWDISGPHTYACLYRYIEPVECCRRYLNTGYSMDMILRPGEALTWRWGHKRPARFRSWKDLVEETGYEQNRHVVANGLWQYQPDLQSDNWREGAIHVGPGIVATDRGLVVNPAGRAGDAGREAITWKIHAPYLMVGGRLNLVGANVAAEISFDGRTWASVSEENFDQFFPAMSRPRHSYYVRVWLTRESRLSSISFSNDLQMAPLSLPALQLGSNAFHYRDDNSLPGRVEIAHVWNERTATRRPSASPRPVFPANGVQGLPRNRFAFEWEPAETDDGTEIIDYHFQISDDPRMRWPLSPTYDRLTAIENRDGSPKLHLDVSDLIHEHTYYWRVRAKSSAGVWGPWSDRWTFSIRGPARPMQLDFGFDREKGAGFLTWDSSGRGTRPVRYRIYGSNLQGFVCRDDRHLGVRLSDGKISYVETAPNLVREITAEEFEANGRAALGEELFAFYRVISIDESGNRSSPSRQLHVARPLIVSQPPDDIRAGRKFVYAPRVIASKGFIARIPNWHYKDRDRLTFELIAGPDWLTLSPDGELSGTAPEAGSYQVGIRVRAEGVGDDSQTFVLVVRE